MAGTLLPRIRPLALISPDSAGALVDRYTDDAAPQGAHLSALPSIFPSIAQTGHAGPAGLPPFATILTTIYPGPRLALARAYYASACRPYWAVRSPHGVVHPGRHGSSQLRTLSAPVHFPHGVSCVRIR